MKRVFLILLLMPTLTFSQNDSCYNSIDGIVNEVLSIISGEKGKKRDWKKFKSLFLPTAKFNAVFHINDTTTKLVTLSLDEFIEKVGPEYEKNGFLEKEISKTVDEYNGIAQVFQSYYAKQNNHEEKGINALQLIYNDNRWWVVSVMWTSNANGAIIPEKYLHK